MRVPLCLLATSLAAMLTGCGSPPAEDTAEPTVDLPSPPAIADAAPASFMQCKVCHAVEPGKHGVGPSLAGVYGTKSGEIAGFVFSDAMKNAGLTWDDKTLDEYLASPMTKVPGTKMSFAGLTDPAKRKEVIEYLKTLK